MKTKRKLLSVIMSLVLLITVFVPFDFSYAQESDSAWLMNASGRSCTANVIWKIKLYDGVGSSNYITVNKSKIEDDILVKDTFSSKDGSVWYLVDSNGLTEDNSYCYVKAKDLLLDESKVTIEAMQEAAVSIEGVDEDSTFQWQVYIPSVGIWANLLNETESECIVNYTMLLGILNDKGQGVLRCKINTENGTENSPVILINANEAAAEEAANLDEETDVIAEKVLESLNEESDGEQGEISIISDENEMDSAKEIIEESEQADEKCDNCDENCECENESQDLDNENGIPSDVTIEISEAIDVLDDEEQNTEMQTESEGLEGEAELNDNSESEEALQETEIVPENEEANNEFSLMGTETNGYYVTAMCQKLDDSNAYEKYGDKELKNGNVGEIAPTTSDLKNIPGFTLVKYETAVIDDELKLDVSLYYDRKYVLMMFNSNGGINCPEAIYAKYGTAIGNIESPSKSDYKFAGWYSDKECKNLTTIPTTVPENNSIYYAGWSRIEGYGEVRVVYWKQNADDDDYTYSKTESVQAPVGSYYTEKLGNYYECDKVEHTHTDACIDKNHTHTAACYGLNSAVNPNSNYLKRFKTLLSDNDISNDNFVEGYVYDAHYVGLTGLFSTHNYYVYFDKNWYSVSESQCGEQVGNTLKPSGAWYEYNLYKWNPDTSSCVRGYTCGYTEHKHSNSCGVSKVYKVATSTTVYVSANGYAICNVYLDRIKYTYNFGEGSEDKKYGSITAKAGAFIQDQYLNMCDSKFGADSRKVWYTDDASVETYMVTHMATEDRQYYLKNDSTGTVEFYYWLQKIGAGSTHNEQNYEKTYKSYASDGYNYTADEDFINITGFTYTYNVQAGSNINNNKNLYYDRNSYTVTLDSNDGSNIKKSFTVQYGVSFTSIPELMSFVPTKSNLVGEGYSVFSGWYKNPECSGESVDLSNLTMPASDISFYACWSGEKKTVQFFTNEDCETELTSQTVLYGDKISSPPSESQINGTKPAGNENVVFLGWYYKESGVECAFDVDNMTVTRDVKLYPKWGTSSINNIKTVGYKIYFKLKQASATDIDVAKPVEGVGQVGTIKIFDPKVTKLYASYSDLKPDSLTPYSMTINEDESKNVYYFYYSDDLVLIKYTAGTGGKTEPASQLVGKQSGTPSSTAIAYKGYTFDGWYSDNAYKNRINGNKWTSGTSITPQKDNQGNAVFANSEYFAKFNENFVTVQYSCNKGGSVSIISDTALAATGQLKTVNAIPENGYEFEGWYYDSNYITPVTLASWVSGTSLTPQKTVDVNNPGQYAYDSNSYYAKFKEKTVTYVYRAGTGGSVSISADAINAVSGTPKTVSAIPAEYYEFAGWFTDSSYNTPVNAGWISGTSIIPQQIGGIYVGGSYYAKFKKSVSNLTISKTGMEEGEYAVFEIFKGSYPIVTVSMKGKDGCVTISGLDIGETYTVKEDKAWSWKYKTESEVYEKTIKINENESQNAVSFTNISKDKKWLTHESVKKNVFNKANNV